MRILKYSLISAISVFTLFGVLYFQKPHVLENSINKEFDISEHTEIIIENDFGNIELELWDQPKVLFEITMIASAESKKMADAFIKNSKVEFSQSGDKIYAETFSAEAGKKSWWEFWNKNNYTFSTYYKVKIPRNIDLYIENGQGNISIPAIIGDLNIDMSYGDLELDKVSGKSVLSIHHGKAYIGTLNQLKAKFLSSHINIHQAESLEIESKQSKIKINKCLDASIYSKYDRYTIGEIKNLVNEGGYDNFDIAKADVMVMSARFTDLNLREIGQNLSLEMTSGSVSILGFSSTFKSGEINGSYTNFNVNLPLGCNFELMGTNTNFKLDEGLNIIEKKDLESIQTLKGSSPGVSKSTIIGEFYEGGVTLELLKN